MLISRCLCRMQSALLLPLVLLSPTVLAMEEGALISLGIGEQKILQFPSNLTKVATSDPEVAGVTVSAAQELLLTAKKSGSAILSVWLEDWDQAMKAPLMVAPTQGEKVPFGTQVQTNIRILEVSRTELNAMGLYYSRLFNNGQSAFGLAPPGNGFRGFPGNTLPTPPLGAEGFNLFSFGENSLTIINALESGGFAYTLAEPSLTTLSGQSATFLSGGEFPIPVRSDDDGVQVEFKEFGVSLSLTPTVISAEQIILAVAPEVSELDFASGVSSGGISIPGLRVRRAQTTISLGPGETFIISGLVSRNTINHSDRVPGLASIPLVGALFRSSRIEKEDKELVMVVTPHIVVPSKQDPTATVLPGVNYHNSSMGWLDMATQAERGSQPIRHGLSW